MRIVSDLQKGFDYTRSNPAGAVWRTFSSSTNKHPLIQFFKYGICGVIATLVQQAVFAALGYTVLPHFEVVAEPLGLTMNQRAFHFALCSIAGFVVADFVCYALNIKYVFEPGRHKTWVAFLLFTAFASVGFTVGLAMAITALKSGVAGSWGASITLIIVSVLVNYFFRKFFVFKG